MLDQQTTGTDNHETKYGCNTCAINFDSREEQSSHMRESWHVYNLKRRIASLPPISVAKYYERVLASDSGNGSAEDPSPSGQSSTDRCPSLGKSTWHSRDNRQPSVDEGQFSPLQCLFCNIESASMESNLIHMSLTHSFFIPDPEYLTDMESLLSYLFIVISNFHECLYCGSVRASKTAVQDHMRGKGHCRLDFEDDERDLEQFYEFSSDADEDHEPDGKPILVPDDDELRLPSGKILGHRSRAHVSRRKLSGYESLTTSSRKPLSHMEPESTPTISNDQKVAVRNGTSTSMVGVSELRQRALMAVERKVMKTGKREMNEYQSKVERGGNKQKRYRVQSLGKKMGGLEKRLG